MNSDDGNRRCRRLGSPIRTSPDHRLCASPRGFSQLTTSFIAFLRLGIPTHALSSLTIKLISNTEVVSGQWPVVSRTDPRHLPTTTRLRSPAVYSLHGRTCNLCSCPSIFSFQRSWSALALIPPRFRTALKSSGENPPNYSRIFFCSLRGVWWAWVDSNYRPHPYQGCALTT